MVIDFSIGPQCKITLHVPGLKDRSKLIDLDVRRWWFFGSCLIWHQHGTGMPMLWWAVLDACGTDSILVLKQLREATEYFESVESTWKVDLHSVLLWIPTASSQIHIALKKIQGCIDGLLLDAEKPGGKPTSGDDVGWEATRRAQTHHKFAAGYCCSVDPSHASCINSRPPFFNQWVPVPINRLQQRGCLQNESSSESTKSSWGWKAWENHLESVPNSYQKGNTFTNFHAKCPASLLTKCSCAFSNLSWSSTCTWVTTETVEESCKWDNNTWHSIITWDLWNSRRLLVIAWCGFRPEILLRHIFQSKDTIQGTFKCSFISCAAVRLLGHR